MGRSRGDAVGRMVCRANADILDGFLFFLSCSQLPHEPENFTVDCVAIPSCALNGWNDALFGDLLNYSP